MTALIVVVALTLIISSQCSLYESVLYSTRMGTLESEKTSGRHTQKAVRMIKLKSRISVPLSAILILNTIANTAGATLAGMYASKTLGDHMVPTFSIGFTLLILLIGEIIPKTMGALHWRALWPTIIWPLTLMKYALYPIIFVTQQITAALSSEQEKKSTVTEADILGTIRLGARDGEISQWESQLLHNIINLETKKVEEIMTPRTVVFSMNEQLTVEEAFKLAVEKGFTRIPVYRNERENIIGYVMINDLSTAQVLSLPGTTIKSITKPIMFVREDENCLVLLTSFLKRRLHIAMIGDDYGGVAGLVTLEDLIETVLGTEIVDENESVVDLQKLARNRMQKRFYLEREMHKNESDGGEAAADDPHPIIDSDESLEDVTPSFQSFLDSDPASEPDEPNRRHVDTSDGTDPS